MARLKMRRRARPVKARDPSGRRWLRHPDSSVLLGHTDVRTTMVDTHVLNWGGKGMRGPADALVQGLSPAQR